MKKITRLISTIALIFGSIANECEAQIRNPLPGSDYRSAVKFREKSVTMTGGIGTHILVTVNINGSPVKMALDTGSNYSLISAPAAKELKLKSKKGNYVGCQSKEYTEAKILIGNISVKNQRLCAILQKGLVASVADKKIIVPGILGYDFLRNFIIEVDYSGGIVRLHNPKTFKFSPDKSYVGEVPFNLVRGRPHIDVTLVFKDESRRHIDALVDTGSWFPVKVTDTLSEIMTKISPYRWEFGREWVLNVPRINNYEPGNLSGETDFGALLGNPAFDRYKVFFDYPRSRLLLSDTSIR